MRNRPKFARALALALVILPIATLAVLFFLAVRGLDRDGSNHANSMNGWQPIGGKWSEESGIISNKNYGRGDMLIAQHSKGPNYRIAAELRFNLHFRKPSTEMPDW